MLKKHNKPHTYSARTLIQNGSFTHIYTQTASCTFTQGHECIPIFTAAFNLELIAFMPPPQLYMVLSCSTAGPSNHY